MNDLGAPDLEWSELYPPISRVVFIDHDGDAVRLWRDATTLVLTGRAVHIPLSQLPAVLERIEDVARHGDRASVDAAPVSHPESYLNTIDTS